MCFFHGRTENVFTGIESAAGTVFQFADGFIFPHKEVFGMTEKRDYRNGLQSLFCGVGNDFSHLFLCVGKMIGERMEIFGSDSAFQIQYKEIVSAILVKIDLFFDEFNGFRLTGKVHLDRPECKLSFFHTVLL